MAATFDTAVQRLASQRHEAATIPRIARIVSVTEFVIFYLLKTDEIVKSIRWVIPDLIRNPETIENTGCRIKSGMTTHQSPDFLRMRQD